MRLERLPSELAVQSDYLKLWLGQTLYQMIAPDEMRGRVFAVRQTFSTILSPVSMLAVGWAVDAVGTRPVFVALGAIAVIAAAAIALSPVARESPHFGGRPRAAGTAA